MIIKYKVSEVAKDQNKPAKQIIDTLADLGGEPKKVGANLDEAELNYLFERMTQESAEADLSAYLDSAPKPKPKESEILKKADGTVVEMPRPRHKAEKKPEAAAPAPKREVVTKVVDTRTVDVNLDKFNEKYTELAGTKNVENRRKPTPAGNKQKFTNNKNRGRQPFQKKRETEAERLQRIQLEKARKAQLKVQIPDEITVGELASRLKQTASNVIKKLMGLGVMASVSEVVDFDTAAIVAEEFGAKVEKEVHVTIEERLFEVEEDNAADLVERPPVVVVMGHVDHGKTSILDAIRKTHVTAGEAGGITQHIGAYQVVAGGKPITFLDTPGHEAFTSMRARGANMTDIAVLVVAADDGIMPQTVEAINHAKAAKIPIIVAINKMDKHGANPDRIKQQLTEYDLVPEEWGGDTVICPISAKTGQGIDELLEMVILTSEVQELKANPNRAAKGTVIEARLDRTRGPIATLLIQNGTLNQGDVIIAGTAVGRVRVMTNDKGRTVKTAGPSVPVEITGLADVPAPGDEFNAVSDERMARELVEQRRQAEKDAAAQLNTKITLDNLFAMMQEGEMKDLNLIVKADVQGSAEALKASLLKLSNDEVRVKVIHTGVGAVNESDILLASTANAIIIGFNVRPDAAAQASAQRAKVDVRMYRVIYDAINEIEAALKGMLAPKYQEVVIGHAEVRQTYKVSAIGTIAGCYVKDGKVTRDAQVRVLRDHIVLHQGAVGSLQRFKDSVKEVTAGYECGMSIDRFNDIKEGDVFECFAMEEIKQ